MDTIIQPSIGPQTRGRYRRHSDEFKRAVVAQSLLPNASVSRIAREHNVNANQVFAWRKLFGEGQLATAETACTLLPVTLATPASVPRVAKSTRVPSGVIELMVGKACLRLQGPVDATALNLVLQRLLP